jgi:hypothetical protein
VRDSNRRVNETTCYADGLLQFFSRKVTTMFLEYARWLGFSPESQLTAALIIKALLLAGSGLLLVLAGFKVKGTLGAVLALLLGTVLYLYVRSY